MAVLHPVFPCQESSFHKLSHRYHVQFIEGTCSIIEYLVLASVESEGVARVAEHQVVVQVTF